MKEQKLLIVLAKIELDRIRQKLYEVNEKTLFDSLGWEELNEQQIELERSISEVENG